ncbi:MAG: GTP pyrophosphokinase family protein [Ruminococcus sp.]|nr:GTP pyrophosphokinase family protein [Ruminococcus sp.]
MNEKDLKFYGIYAKRLTEIEQILFTEIRSMLDSVSTDPETALAEHLKTRIKDSDSLREKLRRFDLPETAQAGLNHLSDIVGARIITHFVGDIYTVLDMIEKSDKWQLVVTKDYIASPKPNGYRSLHTLLRMPFGCGGISTIDVEIQLRTIAQDCWASLEHQLKYKKTIHNTNLIVSELKRCADEMASTDLSMQTIRDLIRNT